MSAPDFEKISRDVASECLYCRCGDYIINVYDIEKALRDAYVNGLEDAASKADELFMVTGPMREFTYRRDIQLAIKELSKQAKGEK